MPVTPAALAKRRKAITFDYGDDAVNVEYYLAAVSSESAVTMRAWGEQAKAVQSEEEGQQVLLDFGAWVCTILAKWDYCEDADPATPDVPGPMVPITPERIAQETNRFGDFITAVLTAIFNDRFVGNANGTTPPAPSDATSSPTESSTSSPEASSLSSTASSSSPSGSGAEDRPSNG